VSPPPSHPTGAIFPKEFRKRIYADLDRRFLGILLVSFIVHVGLVYYLAKHAPKEKSPEALAKIQQKYVEGLLRLEEEVSLELSRTEEVLEAERFGPELIGTVRAISEMAEAPEVEIPEPEAPKAETTLPPAETLGEKRELAAASRERGRAVLSENVRDIGLLGVITAGSGVVDYAEIADILQFADSTSANLAEALAFLEGLKIPRGGLDYGAAVSGDAGVDGLTPEARQRLLGYVPLRGERYVSDGVDTDKLIGQPVMAQTIPVARTETFVDVPSETGIGTHASDGQSLRSYRDPNRVREVVVGHNASIQDCYKYYLRRNPNLRGKIVIRFTVTPEGRVSRAMVLSSTFNLPRLEECILNKVRRWNDFDPVLPEVGDLTFRQTYIFSD
jgi:TonB family protein